MLRKGLGLWFPNHVASSHDLSKACLAFPNEGVYEHGRTLRIRPLADRGRSKRVPANEISSTPHRVCRILAERSVKHVLLFLAPLQDVRVGLCSLDKVLLCTDFGGVLKGSDKKLRLVASVQTQILACACSRLVKFVTVRIRFGPHFCPRMSLKGGNKVDQESGSFRHCPKVSFERCPHRTSESFHNKD